APVRVEFRMVTPNYFSTMRIPFVQGEGLPAVADSAGASAIVINHTMAEKYWAGQNPIGGRIQLFGTQGPWFNIVGVVGDVRQAQLESPAREEVYLAYQRNPGLEISLVVRTTGDPEALRNP